VEQGRRGSIKGANFLDAKRKGFQEKCRAGKWVSNRVCKLNKKVFKEPVQVYVVNLNSTGKKRGKVNCLQHEKKRVKTKRHRLSIKEPSNIWQGENQKNQEAPGETDGRKALSKKTSLTSPP